MPSPEEFGAIARIGSEALSEFAPGAARAFDTDLSEIFGGATVPDQAAATELSTRLSRMHPDAPMGNVIRQTLATGDPETISALRDYFSLPTEARSLLTDDDLDRISTQLIMGTPSSLAAVRSTLGVVEELAPAASPDPTSAEVLRAARLAGVGGDNPWAGRIVHI